MIKKFLKSFYAPITILVIIILFLMGFNKYLINNMNYYVLTGEGENYYISDGGIYIGFDVNSFTSPKINYLGDNIKLKDYTIGYYIKVNGKYKEISVKRMNTEVKEVSIKSIIEEERFSFTETHKDSKYFTKSNIKNIKKLYFKLDGTDTKGNSISLVFPINVEKVTR